MKLPASSYHHYRIIASIFALAGVLCLVAALSFWLLPQDMPVSMARNISASHEDAASYTDILSYRFTQADLQAYNEAFDAQEVKNWAAADAAIAKLEDKTLVGDLLAARFLHQDYDTSYVELNDWLQHYNDMPIAPRVIALARQKKTAVDDALPTLPKAIAYRKPLEGVGIRDGLQGEAMPVRWKAGLAAWSNRHYSDAAKIFSSVANEDGLSDWQASAGNYWAYRAYTRLGNGQQADEHLNQAAQHPLTLYGALAAHQLGHTPAEADRLPAVDSAMLAVPAVHRAALYSALGRHPEADREIRTLYSHLPPARRKQLLTITAQLNLPALQLRIAQSMEAGTTGADYAAYPVPNWLASDDKTADQSLVFAIVRQESGFNPEARNPNSGAAGAMQLMPSTARYVIETDRLNEVKLASLEFNTLGEPAISVNKLSDPTVNLTVGQHYINYLAQKPFVEGNLIHLLAAYNAGPANLIAWQKRFSEIEDPLFFIEMIPFRETRHYVTQVLTNYVIYSQMMEGRDDTAEALSEGKWPIIETPAIQLSSDTQ